jgi:signal transduction histidine kinase
LTSIHGFLKMIQSQVETENIKDYIDITLEEVNRINSVTNELLFLAKPQEEIIKTLDLSKLINDVIQFIDSEAHLKNITIITLGADARLGVNGIANHLKQVFLNIFKNSIEAMPDGGEIRVVLKTTEQFVQVKVTDQGVGIPEDRLKHIGEPFYSLKENGTGLGLMITQKIVKEHHGIFEIKSSQGEGTTISIKLPQVTM